VIVDARFSLIVDEKAAASRVRRSGAQALLSNVAQPSTISLKRGSFAGSSGSIFRVYVIAAALASRIDREPLSSILWLECATRSRIASASGGVLRWMRQALTGNWPLGDARGCNPKRCCRAIAHALRQQGRGNRLSFRGGGEQRSGTGRRSRWLAGRHHRPVTDPHP
jgi:hypothetical protein